LLAGIAGSNPAGGRGSVSLVSVVCCQVKVLAKGSSLVQRSPTDCGVSECDRAASIIRRPWHISVCRAMEYIYIYIYIYKVRIYMHIHISTTPKLCCSSPLSEQLF
jgi:hypothetical protein